MELEPPPIADTEPQQGDPETLLARARRLAAAQDSAQAAAGPHESLLARARRLAGESEPARPMMPELDIHNQPNPFDNAHTSPGVTPTFDNVLQPASGTAPTADNAMLPRGAGSSGAWGDPVTARAVGARATVPGAAPTIQRPPVQLTPADTAAGPVRDTPAGAVIDTNRPDAAGHVPTHRIDQPTNKLPGESWEDYETRVLARRSFSPDTAQQADPAALEPDVRAKADSLLSAAKAAGVPLSIRETRRSQERQEMLFQKGRGGAGGSPVTWTLTSDHTPGRALDLDGSPRALEWLQANAPAFGFKTMGSMDPGHIAIPAEAPAASVPPLPAPTLAADATRTGEPEPNPAAHRLTGPARIAAQYFVNPAMEHPFATAAMFTPPGALYAGAGLVGDLLHYATQKTGIEGPGNVPSEAKSPEQRAEDQKPVPTVPGEQVAVDAAMIGASMFLHGLHRAADVSKGVMEAGAKGAKAAIRADGMELGRAIKNRPVEPSLLERAQQLANEEPTPTPKVEAAPPVPPPVPPPFAPQVPAPSLVGRAQELIKQQEQEAPPPAPKSAPPPPITTNFDKTAQDAFGQGRDTRVLLNDGQKLPARYRVVSASKLQSSHDPFSFTPNPNYPEGVQGRDYQRNKAAQEVMSQRALSYDADRALNPSQSAGEGAPTVLPNGVVVAGNERSILPRRAMQQAPERYAAYVQQLKERAAEFGIDPAHIDQTENPILVRELTDAKDVGGGPSRWGEINRLSDEATTKAKSAAEEGAASSAKLLQATDALDHLGRTMDPDSTLSAYLGTADGRTFVQKLVEHGVISREDVARMTEKGVLTEDGRTAVRRMLLSTAVSDPAALLDAPAGVVNKLEHAVPSIITTRGTKFDISRLTTAALRMVAEARAHGITIGDLAGQENLFGGGQYPEVVTHMASALDEMKPTELKNAFRRYAAIAREAMGSAETTDMFGGTGYDTARKVFDEAFQAENQRGDDAFFSPDRPEMRGKIDAEEMAQRAKAGETKRAVRDLTGNAPEPLSRDRQQGEMFGAEEPRTAPPVEPGEVATNFDDQLGLFSPEEAKGAVDSSPRPPPTMDVPKDPETFLESFKRKVLGQKNKDVIPLIKISRKLAAALDMPLRQGRAKLKERKALGVFFGHTEVQRVRRFDMVGTVAHELGHYVSKRWLGNPTIRKNRLTGQPNVHFGTLPRGAVAELVQMGKDLYGSRKPAGGYGEEGVAEWLKHYVVDHAALSEKAPEFTQFMDGIFQKDPMLRETLEWARQHFERHSAATPTERMRAMVSVGESDRKGVTARELVHQWVDDMAEFDRATGELAKQSGKPVPAELNAGMLAHLSGGSGGVAENILEYGVPTEPGEPTRASQGIIPILSEVPKGKLAAFRDYIIAHRVVELHDRGVNSGIRISDAAHILQGPDAATFRPIAEKVWEFQNAIIDYRRKGGLLTAEEAAKIKELNKQHVPLRRVFEPDEASGATFGSNKPRARNSSGLHRIFGSGRQIIDPLEQIVQDAYQTARQVSEQAPIEALVKLATKTEGGGRVLEEVPAPRERIVMSADRVKAQLRDLGFGPPGWEGEDVSGLSRDEAWKDAMSEGVDGLLESFRDKRSAGPTEAKDMVVSAIVGGKRRWFAVKDRPLYEAIKALTPSQHNQLLQLTSIFTRALRTGATLTMEFTGANAIRDARTAAIYSRAGSHMIGTHFAKGIFHLLGRTELYHEWQLSGGDQASILPQDRLLTQQSLNKLLASPYEKAFNIVRHPIETLRIVPGLVENATRLGEYALRSDMLAKDRSVSTKSRRIDAGWSSREVTQDFRRAGTVARSANQIIAFFTAHVGGNAKIVRELKERPGVVIPRLIAQITLPSIALQLMQQDDEAYKNLPAWQHAMFDVIVQRDEQGNLEHIWRIPRAPGIGQLFGYLPQQLIKFAQTRDPRAVEQMATALMNELNPVGWPTFATPIIEDTYNESLFRQRKIVPRSRENLVPGEQYAPHTGDFARQVGRLAPVSPAKLENTVSDLTGGLGMYGMGVADYATRKAREGLDLPPLTDQRQPNEDPLTEFPLAKRFTARMPGGDAESVQQFYDEYENAKAVYDSYKAIAKDPRRHREASGFLAQHRREIQAVASKEDTGGDSGPLRQAYEMMSRIEAANRGGRVDEQRVGSMLRAIAENPAVTRAYRHPVRQP